MSDEAPQKKDEGGGAPAWVMTFADLMSLLMCFFVLLLSFAEMDLLKFKQIAGSMKMAFGVQRDIKVKEMPKGTSIIAQEFSPGKPTPTLVEDVRQQTIDETKQTLEFTDATTEKHDQGSGEKSENEERAPVKKEQAAAIRQEIEKQLEQMASLVTEVQESITEVQQNTGADPDKQLDAALLKSEEIEEKIEELKKLDKDLLPNPEVADAPPIEKTRADAQKLMQALAPEIEKGLVSIETEENRILLRIKEQGSFPSGSSTMKGGFMPVIDKLKTSLTTMDGTILVAGHTDNIPIKTKRFRSNWELSSSRAVTVVHELLKQSRLNPRRFTVEGHGSAQPLVPNNNAENRALNRRVELIIVQGGEDSKSEMSADPAPPVDGIVPEDLNNQPPTDEMTTAGVKDETQEQADQQDANLVGIGNLKNRLDKISEGLKQE